jgi:hypothetical protein
MKAWLVPAAILLMAAGQPTESVDPDSSAQAETPAPPGDAESVSLRSELYHEQLRAVIARTRFAGQTDDYQANMYRHHQFWTDAAAVAVYAITVFGLLCAAVQFRLIDRMRGRAVKPEENGADEISAGEVELPGGGKVSSPFLGVIILFISLGFFYLYLTNVYPIVSVAELEAKRAGAPLPPAEH